MVSFKNVPSFDLGSLDLPIPLIRKVRGRPYIGGFTQGTVFSLSGAGSFLFGAGLSLLHQLESHLVPTMLWRNPRPRGRTRPQTGFSTALGYSLASSLGHRVGTSRDGHVLRVS